MKWKKIIRAIFPTAKSFLNFYLMVILLLILILNVKFLSREELFILSFFIVYVYNEWSKEIL